MESPNPSRLSQATQAAMAFTEFVTTKWHSRLVGSEACLASGDYIHAQLKDFCDTAQKEAFSLHPGQFLGFLRVNIISYFLALIALYLHWFALALIPITIGLGIMVFQFLLYKEVIDRFYPKKTGQNVFGTIAPEGEVCQRIIFSAHHDSAHIFKQYENRPEKYEGKIQRGMASFLTMVVLCWGLFIWSTVGMVPTWFYGVSLGILTLASFSLYNLWFFHDLKKGTPGAGDNMVCTAVALEVGKYFAQAKQDGNPLKHTEIMIASWDGEEAGLRGARAFIKRHKTDLKAIKTYNFNLECLFDHTALHFLTSDLNNFVPLSRSMAQECAEIAGGLGYVNGILPLPILAGATDAAEFAKAGIEATTLVGMKWIDKDAKSMAYHTTRDTIEAVDPKAVEESIAIGISYALKKEQALID